MRLVVLTQNIFGAAPAWKMRRDRIARRIARLRPDVIGLQEVHARDTRGTDSQAHELASLVGDYHVDFAPARVTPGGECEGVALLCGHGIRERSAESLTLDATDRLDRSSPRVVLCAMLEVAGIAVDVFVTHLSLSRRARVRTMRELVAFAARERERSGSACAVLMGDLNAVPHEPAIAALEAGDRAGAWLDAWTQAHGRARGGTWPSFAPLRRIDYVFYQPRELWRLEACGREPLSGSDHLGVVARLSLL